jgi:hypothetical protein
MIMNVCHAGSGIIQHGVMPQMMQSGNVEEFSSDSSYHNMLPMNGYYNAGKNTAIRCVLKILMKIVDFRTTSWY